jgi:hypothetical protein
MMMMDDEPVPVSRNRRSPVSTGVVCSRRDILFISWLGIISIAVACLFVMSTSTDKPDSGGHLAKAPTSEKRIGEGLSFYILYLY